MTDSVAVGEGTAVTLHFSLALEGGEVVDSNFDSKPATFSYGDGSLLPGFERALVGMVAGDKGSFSIAPEDGFGQPNANNLQTFERDQFDDSVELSVGLMLSFADAQGAELPGVVASFDEKSVTIDFNHPLAGRTITFDVQILEVTPAVTH